MTVDGINKMENNKAIELWKIKYTDEHKQINKISEYHG